MVLGLHLITKTFLRDVFTSAIVIRGNNKNVLYEVTVTPLISEQYMKHFKERLQH